MAHHPTPLKFLMPGWFVTVMGLNGLTLAWHNAVTLLGNLAALAEQGLGPAAGAHRYWPASLLVPEPAKRPAFACKIHL